jgi:type IV fimbrial biogenesis protein FimT
MRREAGFTLIEMMVTTFVVAILLGIGVPSYRYVTKTNRLSAEINGLLGDLQFARSEAIKDGQQVTVCVPTKNPPATGTCSAAGTAWTNGWVVWVDWNADGTMDADEILRVQAPLASGDTVVPSNAALASLNFNREGFAFGLAADTTFVAKDSTGNAKFTHCLQVTRIGTVRTMTPTTDTTGTCPNT